jgi:predicted small secreted protein
MKRFVSGVGLGFTAGIFIYHIYNLNNKKTNQPHILQTTLDKEPTVYSKAKQIIDKFGGFPGIFQK